MSGKRDIYKYTVKRKTVGVRLVFSALVTAISCFLSYLVLVPLSESVLAKLFSAPETSDFTMSDLFIQFADSRPVRHLDDNIVVVDIGYAGRGEIAEALEAIAIGEPKAVGLDINFPDEKGEVDNYLLETILMQNDIVLPLGLEQQGDSFRVEDKPFFYDFISSPRVHYASANLPQKSRKAAIRDFAVDFRMGSDSVMPSYVTELARLTDAEAYRRLKERGKMHETIDYASREFTVIPVNSLVERIGEVYGKTVLVGSLGDAYDLHATPLNSSAPGLMIHANALATVLDGAWYTYLPDWIDYVVGCVVCFLLVYASETLPGRSKTIALKLIQIAFMILVVWVGYTLFIDTHTLVDLTFTLFVVGFGLLVLDLCNALWNGGIWIKEKREKRKEKRNNEITA